MLMRLALTVKHMLITLDPSPDSSDRKERLFKIIGNGCRPFLLARTSSQQRYILKMLGVYKLHRIGRTRRFPNIDKMMAGLLFPTGFVACDVPDELLHKS